MKIKGKEKFAAQLAALPAAMREEIHKALDVSADETTDLMRRFAPVKTGKLRASIGYTFGAAPKDVGLSTRGNARAAKVEAGLSVTMFAGGGEAYYASFIEHGTRRIRSQPFFFPGYRYGRKRAKDRLARAISKGAKKAFAK